MSMLAGKTGHPSELWPQDSDNGYGREYLRKMPNVNGGLSQACSRMSTLNPIFTQACSAHHMHIHMKKK